MDDKPLLVGTLEAATVTLTLYPINGAPREPLVETTFPTTHQLPPSTLFQSFLQQNGLTPHDVRWILVEPVENHSVEPLLRAWLAELRNFTIAVVQEAVQWLSPMDALAAIVPYLEPHERRQLAPGNAVPRDPIALIRVGPAFEQATLAWDSTRYRQYPSSGGLALVAPTNYLEHELLVTLQDLFGQVSYARVCHPTGLFFLYQALNEIGVAHEPDWLATEIASSDDPVASIIAAAQHVPPCSLCTAAIERYLALLGTAAATFALTVAATGGVYIAGSMLPLLNWMLDQPWFLEAFLQHGTDDSMLQQLPVYQIVPANAVMLGAAMLGLGLA